MSRPVVLLSDFGTVDPFVGIMKCVITARCPGAVLIDLTHDVPAQSVAEGSFWLSRSAPWLPAGAVCVAVIDPGVGTDRRAVVVEARGRLFVGPDNGLLSALAAEPGARAFAIDAVRLGLELRSATFHGRDLFAPVGAELAAGRWSADAVGPAVVDLAPSPLSPPRSDGAATAGTVAVVDRFGNLISDIDGEIGGGRRQVVIGGRRVAVRRTYADVDAGQLVALVSSFGTFEVAERDGSAARALGVGRGAPFRVEPAGGGS